MVVRDWSEIGPVRRLTDLVTRLARVPVVAALVALLVAVSAACNSVRPPALTVGDWSLSQADFFATLEKVSASPSALRALGVSGTEATQAAAGTKYPTTLTAAVLGLYAQSRITVDEANRRSVSATAEQRDQVAQQLAQQLGGGSSASGAAGGASPASLDVLGPLKDVLVDGVASQQALGETLLQGVDVTAQARAAYEAGQDQLQQSCASIILITVPNAETATQAPTAAELAALQPRVDAVKARLDGGADFAALASTDSDEPQSKARGGDIGCRTEAQAGQLPPDVVEAIFTAPVGSVSAPLNIGDGFVFVKVTSRETTPFEQVQAQFESQVRQTEGRARLGELLTRVFEEAKVTVDPLYGRWVAAEQTVVPPEGAQPAPTVPLLGGGAGEGPVVIGPDGQPVVPDGQPVVPGGGAGSPSSGAGATSSGATSSGATSSGSAGGSGSSTASTGSSATGASGSAGAPGTTAGTTPGS
jgi:hypothetical protein